MKVFLDTNVVIDFYARRIPFFQAVADIMDMCFRKEIEVVLSSLTLINTAYILRKAFLKNEVMEKMKRLTVICHISPIDKGIIENAMEKNTKDFEDCVQYYSAMTENVDIIITRNKKDFYFSEITIMSPEEFITTCQS